jgi:hypothetical protein
VGRQLAGLRHWIGVHVVALVLVPLAGVLLWVAIWKVWLPPPGPGSPSRRSGTLAAVLLVLGVGTAVLGLLHDRISSLKLGTSGLELAMTQDQQAGAQELVDQLAQNNAPAGAYVEGLKRYVAKLPATKPSAPASNGQSPADTFKQLAQQIASDLTG